MICHPKIPSHSRLFLSSSFYFPVIYRNTEIRCINSASLIKEGRLLYELLVEKAVRFSEFPLKDDSSFKDFEVKTSYQDEDDDVVSFSTDDEFSDGWKQFLERCEAGVFRVSVTVVQRDTVMESQQENESQQSEESQVFDNKMLQGLRVRYCGGRRERLHDRMRERHCGGRRERLYDRMRKRPIGWQQERLYDRMRKRPIGWQLERLYDRMRKRPIGWQRERPYVGRRACRYGNRWPARMRFHNNAYLFALE